MKATTNWGGTFELEILRLYRPNVGGDEDDEGERTEPGISNGEDYVERYLRTSEEPQREYHHAQRQRKRDQIKQPHLSL